MKGDTTIEILHSAIDLLEGYEKCPRCDMAIKKLPIGHVGPVCDCGFSWRRGVLSKKITDTKTQKPRKGHYTYVVRR